MQGPLRVVQVGAAERAQVGPARQDQRVHVVVGGDRADRDHCHAVLAADLVADPVRERRLVAAAEGRLLLADHLPGGHVDAGRAVLGERPRDLDGLLHPHAALAPVSGRDPHGHRPVLRPDGPDRVEDRKRVAEPGG